MSLNVEMISISWHSMNSSWFSINLVLFTRARTKHMARIINEMNKYYGKSLQETINVFIKPSKHFVPMTEVKYPST